MESVPSSIEVHNALFSILNKIRSDTLLQIKKYDDLIYIGEDDLDEEDGGIDLGSGCTHRTIAVFTFRCPKFGI